MSKLSELIPAVTPVERTVPIALDGGAGDRIRTLLEQATNARATGDTDKADELFEQIGDIGRSTQLINFTFRALPPDAFHELLDEHPPTAEQRDSGLRYNNRTIEPAVVRASLVDPEPDEFDEFWSRLSYGQQQALVDAAWSVNTDGVELPFLEAASLITPPSKQTSRTSAKKASPSRSSAAGGAKKPRRTTTKKAASPATP